MRAHFPSLGSPVEHSQYPSASAAFWVLLGSAFLAGWCRRRPPSPLPSFSGTDASIHVLLESLCHSRQPNQYWCRSTWRCRWSQSTVVWGPVGLCFRWKIKTIFGLCAGIHMRMMVNASDLFWKSFKNMEPAGAVGGRLARILAANGATEPRRNMVDRSFVGVGLADSFSWNETVE